MEEEVLVSKWEAKVVSRRLRKASADQIWPFLQDFFGIHKWFPSLSNSYGIHGNNGEIGSIRYCTGSSIPSQRSGVEISWSKERLIGIDSDEKSLSYEIIDSNIGFNSYVSTIKIIYDGNQEGCFIEWSFTVDPVAGLKFEDLVKKYELGLERMVEKMEGSLEILKSSSSTSIVQI
ncbi:hypothetical protein M9H77_19036 [Catharanthus roseus]|uniref:Uncharacterized protein n=1 Tax=Catharanthus roseus TaxID=4058 RepID=A0ACC0B989_CATRO|nr:hypothetical protein M9H77_19036 [Catharanthus roseus]